MDTERAVLFSFKTKASDCHSGSCEHSASASLPLSASCETMEQIDQNLPIGSRQRCGKSDDAKTPIIVSHQLLGISQKSGCCPAWLDPFKATMRMQDIHKIRRENLQRLLTTRGGSATFAKQTRKPPSYISRVKNGKKNLGEKLARAWEAAAQLEPGYFDQRIHVTTPSAVLHESNDKAGEAGEAGEAILSIIGRLLEAIGNATEAEILNLFRKCSPEGQQVIVAVARSQAATTAGK